MIKISTFLFIIPFALTGLAQSPAPTSPRPNTAQPPKQSVLPTSSRAEPSKQTSARPAASPGAKPSFQSHLDQVLEMVKARMPTTVILATIVSSKIKIGPNDLITLHRAGASEGLLEAIARGVSSSTPKPDEAAEPVAGRRGHFPPVVEPTVAAFSIDLSQVRCEVPSQQRKRVLAVSDFDFGAMKTAEQAVLDLQSAVGKGMAALAIKRLSEAGKFRVVERGSLNVVTEEQRRGASSSVKQGTNARAGRIIGADSYLLGTIVTFGSDNKENRFGGLLGSWGKGLGGIGLKFRTDKFVVAVNFRLVDTETSEIIAQGEARGESTRKSRGVDLGGIFGGKVAGAGIDMTASGFEQTIAGEAIIAAMSNLMKALNENEQKIPLRFLDSSSRIATIDGAKVVLAAGSINGVLPCDRFTVNRIDEEIKDPVTGEILDLKTHKVGELLVTDVRDKVAHGFFEGKEPPKVNDVAEKTKPTRTDAVAPSGGATNSPSTQTKE